MAKKIKGGSVEFEVTDGGSLKKLEKNSKRAGEALGSVAKNAQEADRRLKGTANMSSNSTKNFAKQAQSISGGLVPAYATLAAQVFAVSAAFEFLKSAFNTRNLIEGQKAFSAVTGVAYRSLTKDIKAATNGMLSFEEAAQAAAIGTAAGLTRGQLTQIGKAATDVSLALGRDLTDSFNRLTRGITKAEPELLDELGIVLRLDPAMKNYAASVGKAVSDLTQFERSQAIANEVLGQAESKFGAIQKIMDPSAFALGQFSAAFNDLMVKFKVGLVEFLTPAIKFLSENVEALVGALALGLAPVLRSILPDFKMLGAQATKTANAAKAAAAAARGDAALFTQRAAAAGGEGRTDLMKSSAKQAKALGIGLKGKGDDAGMLSKRQLAIYKNQLDNQILLRKKYNKEEIRLFREFIITQEALLAKRYGEEEAHRKKNEFSEKASRARMNAFLQSSLAVATKTIGAFARTANLALSAIGWIGMIGLVISAGKAVYDFFNPQDAYTKRLKDELDAIKQRTQDIATDLERMAKVQGMGMLSLSGVIEQRGQAAASTDIRQLLIDFNKQIAENDRDGMAASVKAIRNLRSVLGANVVDTAALNDAVNNGVQLTNAQIQAAGALADKYIIAGQASKQFAQDQQALNNAIAGAVNVSLPLSGLATSFSATRKSLAASMGGQDSAIAASRRALSSANEDVQKQVDRRRAFLTSRGFQDILAKDEKKRSHAEQQSVNMYKLAEAQLRDALNLQTAITEQIESQTKEAEEKEKLLKKLETREASILKLQDEGMRLAHDKISLDQKSARLPINNEVGTQNAREKLKVEAQQLKLREAQQAQAAALENFMINGATNDEQVRKDLIYKLAITGQLVDLESDKLDLVYRQTDQQILLNKLADQQLETTRSISRSQLVIAQRKGVLDLARGRTGSRAGNRALDREALSIQKAQVKLIDQELEQANKNVEALKDNTANETLYKDALDKRRAIIIRLTEATNALALAQQKLTNADFFKRQEARLDDMFAARSVSRGVGGLGGATMLGGEYEQQALDLLKSTNRTDLAQLNQAERAKLKETVNAAVSARIQLDLMQDTSTAIQGAFTGVFDALLDGTKSLKQALGDMMKQLLADLAKAYLKAAMLKALQSTGLGFPGARYGGIMSPSGKSFAGGGIASGPTSGYMATLHGTEAVVPLGNDRSIPVELKGAGGGNVVNVSVNVAADGQSSVNTQGGNMEGLGKVIGQAVQQELMRQKRPGGMLSPYGAA